MTANETPANGRKSLILNAFVEMCSGHQSPGLWQHPEDESWRFNDVDHWVELAKLLESAKFHGIFIADVLGSLPSHSIFVYALLMTQAATMSTRALGTLSPLLSLALNGLSMSHWLSSRPWLLPLRTLASVSLSQQHMNPHTTLLVGYRQSTTSPRAVSDGMYVPQYTQSMNYN